MINVVELFKKEIPLSIIPEIDLRGKRVGHAIIDAVNGFCTPGMGNLAPRAADPRIDGAIDRIDGLAHQVLDAAGEVFTERDVHDPNTPEYPHPTHCTPGSGEELLVQRLQWLVGQPGVTDAMKHCVNALIGSMRFGGGNGVIEWIINKQIQVLILSGFCTDICVLEYLLTLMSIRNMRQLQFLEKVIIVPSACATYDLPLSVAIEIGNPALAHPADIFHQMGLTLMQKSGAILADKVIV